MIRGKYIQKLHTDAFFRKEECCGCAACFAICPKVAISMMEDEEGFEYPKIDESKCVSCFQCVRVCPIKQWRGIEKL